MHGICFLKEQCSYGFMNQQKSIAAHRAFASPCTKQSAILYNTSQMANENGKTLSIKCYKMLNDVVYTSRVGSCAYNMCTSCWCLFVLCILNAVNEMWIIAVATDRKTHKFNWALFLGAKTDFPWSHNNFKECDSTESFWCHSSWCNNTWC